MQCSLRGLDWGVGGWPIQPPVEKSAGRGPDVRAQGLETPANMLFGFTTGMMRGSVTR